MQRANKTSVRKSKTSLLIEQLENRDLLAANPIFAPYVNTLQDTSYDFSAAARAGDFKYMALGFIDADAQGRPSWQGQYPLGSAVDNQIHTEVNKLRALGGDVIVSFGGDTENSPVNELAVSLTTVTQLQAAYQQVIDAYSLKYLDFDIEGDKMINNQASVDRRSQAIAGLQRSAEQAGRELHIFLTLPTSSAGLMTWYGMNVLDSALKHGVKLDGVNIMTMNYSDGIDYDGVNGPTMGDAAINAATGLFRQIKTELNKYGVARTDSEIWSMVGITPMIGVNGSNNGTEVFTLDDAQKVVSFARDNGVGLLGFWAIGRDQNPNDEGGLSEAHSGVQQEAFAYSHIFSQFDDMMGPQDPEDPQLPGQHEGFTSVDSQVGATGPQLLAQGHFNNDNYQDVATTNLDGSISILLGKGDGTFEVAKKFYVNGIAGPEGIVVGDFDGDGFDDLAVASNGGANTPGAVTILHGNNNGTFTRLSTLAFPANNVLPTYLATADMDGDGKLDLVVADYNNPNVWVFLGQGDGTFYYHDTNFAANGVTNGEQVVIADFNGDNLLDVAVANKGDGSVSLFRGLGAGYITSAGNIQLPAMGSIGLAAGDLDGDSMIDLAIANYGTDAQGARRLNVLLNTSENGAISFGNPVSIDLGDHLLNVVIDDFDADGRNDLAVTSAGNTVDPNARKDSSVWVLYNRGQGAGQVDFPIPAAALTSGLNPIGLITADLNGDNLIDLVAANQNSNSISAFLNKFNDDQGGDQDKANLDADLSLPAQVQFGVNIDATYTLHRSPDGRMPGGDVTFSIDGVAQARLNLTTYYLNARGIPTIVGPVTYLATGKLAVAEVRLENGDVIVRLALGNQHATGAHTLSAAYTGDAAFNAISIESSFEVLQRDTTTTITSLPATATLGQTVNISAYVEGMAGGITGTVTFFDGDRELGTAVVVNGVAVLSTRALAAGTHSITARYNGDVNFAASDLSAGRTITVSGSLASMLRITRSAITINRFSRLAQQTITIRNNSDQPIALPLTLQFQNLTANGVRIRLNGQVGTSLQVGVAGSELQPGESLVVRVVFQTRSTNVRYTLNVIA